MYTVICAYIRTYPLTLHFHLMCNLCTHFISLIYQCTFDTIDFVLVIIMRSIIIHLESMIVLAKWAGGRDSILYRHRRNVSKYFSGTVLFNYTYMLCHSGCSDPDPIVHVPFY